MAIKTLAALAAALAIATPAMAQFVAPMQPVGPGMQQQYLPYLPPPPPVYRPPMPLPYVPPQQPIQPMIVYPGSGPTFGIGHP